MSPLFSYIIRDAEHTVSKVPSKSETLIPKIKKSNIPLKDDQASELWVHSTWIWLVGFAGYPIWLMEKYYSYQCDFKKSSRETEIWPIWGPVYARNGWAYLSGRDNPAGGVIVSLTWQRTQGTGRPWLTRPNWYMQDKPVLFPLHHRASHWRWQDLTTHFLSHSSTWLTESSHQGGNKTVTV